MATLDELLPDPAASLPPRARSTDSTPLLLTVLLADHGLRERVAWPSAGLVAVLAQFGVSEAAVRAALSRLARRGVLEQGRTGRNTTYRLGLEAAQALAYGGRMVTRFPGLAESWDGRWTVLAFSHPGDGGEARKLRTRLRWRGFAPLYDGLWVSANADPVGTARSIEGLRPAQVTMFRGEVVRIGPQDRDPLQAWDLDAVTGRYRTFVDVWTATLREVDTDPHDGAAALTARTRLVDDYRRLQGVDPGLPLRLMPEGFPRQEACAIFVRGYDGLAGRAERHVREVLHRLDVAAPAGLRLHTVADMADGSLMPTA